MTTLLSRFTAADPEWCTDAVAAVHAHGFAVVEGVLDREMLQQTHERMYGVRDRIAADVGVDRLARAGELGVLRLMLEYDPFFLKFLELSPALAVVDAIVSTTAILHLQNGFILPSFPPSAQQQVFQNTYHQDFPRVLNGYVASVNVFFAIDAFTRENGATWVLPGTHHLPVCPPLEERVSRGVALECPAGSMIVFDSTLWHAAGPNTSGRDRLAINHQFTRSWIKQQIDYVRALGDAVVEAQAPRTQQLLGWYTRVVTSLDEYYRPAEQRLYRKGQG
jgi:ectoine hydroxylase-related dioxygenase (phytanoyl-CoA dioxygenase family)